MNIDKPDKLGKHDLIAVMGFRDTPIKPQDPMKMSYTKSTIAVNPFDDTLLVYVVADTKKGLDEFKKNFPNAEIQKEEPIDKEKWRLTAFPVENAEVHTPLEVYFRGIHKDTAHELERNKIKKEVKRK